MCVLICLCLYFYLSVGVYICLTPIVIVDLLGLEKLSNAFGIVLLFQGIGTVLGPPIAGKNQFIRSRVWCHQP